MKGRFAAQRDGHGRRFEDVNRILKKPILLRHEPESTEGVANT